MKKKIFNLFLAIVILFGITGCGSFNNNNNKTNLESEHIKIDGIYQDESFKDNDLGLLYIFYTVNAGDDNIATSSASTNLKVEGKNEYKSTLAKDYIPSYTNYYYGTFIKNIYVGKSYKMCSTFKIAKGDLEGSKTITLNNVDIDDMSNIKLNTDNIKKMKNIEKISEDLDKTTFDLKYSAYQDKMSDIDQTTINKVRNDLNGYYFEDYCNLGNTVKKCKVEFEAPNKFTVTFGVSNSGTYEVKKGVITLDYGKGPQIFLDYSYEDGEIYITNLKKEFGTKVEYDPLGE